jgi:hypothetical protein
MLHKDICLTLITEWIRTYNTTITLIIILQINLQNNSLICLVGQYKYIQCGAKVLGLIFKKNRRHASKIHDFFFYSK